MEATFLHVWLKREEAKVNFALMLAQGLADAAEGKSNVAPKLKDYIETIFPFVKGSKSEDDKKILETMKKEVAKGPVQFSEVRLNPYAGYAKRVQMDDEYRKRLEQRAIDGRPVRKLRS